MYRELANAIVLQAVKDFRPAYLCLKRFPNDKSAETAVRELTGFFYSDEFCLLSGLDGPVLLKRIIREIDEKRIE